MSNGSLCSYYMQFTVPQVIKMAERGVEGIPEYWIADASVLAAASEPPPAGTDEERKRWELQHFSFISIRISMPD